MSSKSEPEGASRSQLELVFALATDATVAAYFGWIAMHLWRSTAVFAKMFEGLGAELPPATRFVVENGHWFYPVTFAGLLLLLMVKEVLVKDKRLSAILTCLVAVLGQFVSHWLTTVYYLPMFDLVRKLNE